MAQGLLETGGPMIPESRYVDLVERFNKEPLGRACNARLVAIRRGRAVVKMMMRPDHLIFDPPIVQGGIMTVLADFAGVYAAMASIPEGHTPAKRLTIDFLRPIYRSEQLTALAEMENESKTEVLIRVRVTNEEDKLVALSTITFGKPRPKK
jgi:uncharacterized protein (TIGR00369 family)